MSLPHFYTLMRCAFRATPTSSLVLLAAMLGCGGDDLSEIGRFSVESNVANAAEPSGDERHIGITAHDSCIYDLAYSPDGLHLATCSMDQRLRIWDVASRQCLRSFMADGFVLAVCYSRSGNFLVAATIDQGIHVWDTSSWTETIIARTERCPQAIAFSPDGQLMAVGSGTIELFRTSDWRRVGRKGRHDQGGTSLAFSPDGKMIASGNADHLAKLWLVPSMKEKFRWKHDYWVESVGFDPDGKRIATTSFTHDSNSQTFAIAFFDVTNGKKTNELVGPTLRGHIPSNGRLKYSRDGRFILTAINGSHDTGRIENDIIITEEEGSLSLWDNQRKTLLARRHETKRTHCLAFAPDSKSFAVADVHGAIEIIDVAEFVENSPLEATTK